MEFRESKESNNLFFLCSLIDLICRITKNEKKVVVNALGQDNVKNIFDFADTYHCEDIRNVANDFIKKCNIPNGSFDCSKNVHFEIPTFFDIGKVYKRLIVETARVENIGLLEAADKIFNSNICSKIEDYNSSLYYDNQYNIYQFYKQIA